MFHLLDALALVVVVTVTDVPPVAEPVAAISAAAVFGAIVHRLTLIPSTRRATWDTTPLPVQTIPRKAQLG